MLIYADIGCFIIENDVSGDIIFQVLAASNHAHMKASSARTRKKHRNVVFVVPFHAVWETATLRQVLARALSEYDEHLQ